jgi:hypothetical protein
MLGISGSADSTGALGLLARLKNMSSNCGSPRERKRSETHQSGKERDLCASEGYGARRVPPDT